MSGPGRPALLTALLSAVLWTVGSCPEVNRPAIVASFNMCTAQSSTEVPLTQEVAMGTLLIVLLVLFVLGGGGWGYSRWRA